MKPEVLSPANGSLTVTRVRRPTALAPYLPLLVAFSAAALAVGNRDLSIGKDTANYVNFFLFLDTRFLETRLEPGFVFLVKLIRYSGLTIQGYLTCLFLLLAGSALLAIRAYARYVCPGHLTHSLTVLTTSLLLTSPFFLAASINVIRQGIASFLMLYALFSILNKRWAVSVATTILATSIHYSTLLFLASASLLFLPSLIVRIVALALSGLYAVGATRAALGYISPRLAALVHDYGSASAYKTGIRLDFLAFSIAILLALTLLEVLLRANTRTRRATDVYAALLVPFLLLGWGAYSDRLLLPAWLYFVSPACWLVFAAVRQAKKSILLAAGPMIGTMAFLLQLIHASGRH